MPLPCADTTHVLCGLVSKGFEAVISHVAWSCCVASACWRRTLAPSPLGCCASHACDSRDYAQELQPSMHLLTRCLSVNGHHSTSPALLIDRSAEPVESSLPL